MHSLDDLHISTNWVVLHIPTVRWISTEHLHEIRGNLDMMPLWSQWLSTKHVW